MRVEGWETDPDLDMAWRGGEGRSTASCLDGFIAVSD